MNRAEEHLLCDTQIISHVFYESLGPTALQVFEKGKEKGKEVLPEASQRLQRNATGPLSLATSLPAG